MPVVEQASAIPLSTNSLRVLRHRYLRRDKEGTITETPDGMFRRVARAVAQAELCRGTKQEADAWEERFYHLMSELLFLPNSPTLMNAGTENHQLSACFVLPVDDSMNSIFTALKQAALIQQSGGGTGFNFSRLRPAGDLVAGTGGTASGPVSFMKIFDTATEQVKQGGKRRGANMGILNIDHPDIELFIAAKVNETGSLRNFNISVGITNAFMEAVELNHDWPLLHPATREVVKTVRAIKLWNDITEAAWRCGEPGLIFLDAINQHNPTPALGDIQSTNPCGEVPLLPYEACNLGSVNLPKFITSGNGIREIDWQRLEEVITIAIRFLDNVIDVNDYIIPEISRMVKGNRKIGLGVMGWAELLILLEIPYDSDQAVSLAGELMHFIQKKSLEASAALARTRGVFPNWELSRYYPVQPVRNATCNSIAPTGSISIIAGTSSSIEPLFALAFRREQVLEGEQLVSMNEKFIDYLKEHQLFSEQLMEQVAEAGVAGPLVEIPAPVKRIFKTALEISPARHLQHQLAFQQYTDNAVSKTINLPENATITEVDDIYWSAWLQQAKGITIYRYNSRTKQVMRQGLNPGKNACQVCIT